MPEARHAMAMGVVRLDPVVLSGIGRLDEDRVCSRFQSGSDLAPHAVADHAGRGRIGDTVAAQRLTECARVLALADAHSLLVDDVDNAGATDAGELILQLAPLR